MRAAGGLFSFQPRRCALRMTDRHRPDTHDNLARLRQPTVTDAEKPTRRQVAMAYRTAREAMLSHEAAIDAAKAVYFKAHPEAVADGNAANKRQQHIKYKRRCPTVVLGILGKQWALAGLILSFYVPVKVASIF